MTLAPLATPEKVLPCPAAMPATWVPCLQALAAYVQGTPEPAPIWVEVPLGQLPAPAARFEVKQASSTTLLAKNGWALSTPVSSTATTWPLPVKPFAHMVGA
jgi:hypothetical protein